MKSRIENWSLFRLSDRQQFDNLERATVDFFFRALTVSAQAEWLMWREGFSGWRPFSELPEILQHLRVETPPAATPPPIPQAVLKYIEDEATQVLPEVPKPVVESPIEPTEIFHATQSSVSVRALHAATSSLRSKTQKNQEAAKPILSQEQGAPAREDFGNVLTMPEEATLSLMLESQAAVEDRDNVRFQKKFKVRIFTSKEVLNFTTIDCSTSGFRLKDPLPAGLPRFFHVEIDLGPEGKIPLLCSEIRERDGRGSTRVRIQVNDHFNSLKSALVRAA